MNVDDPSGVQNQEIQEGDEEMEEVDEEEDNGSGVGAFLAPPRKKTVKKTFLKKPPRVNTLSARDLTRLVEACSELARRREDEELAEGVPRPELGATVEDNTHEKLSG